MPCDSIANTNLDEYNEVLSVISTFCTTHNVVNYLIGGDINTDLSCTKSLNTISLQNFMDKENIFLAIREISNSVKYTYTGINNSTSLIDHFIVSDNICLLTRKYYTMTMNDNEIHLFKPNFIYTIDNKYCR